MSTSYNRRSRKRAAAVRSFSFPHDRQGFPSACRCAQSTGACIVPLEHAAFRARFAGVRARRRGAGRGRGIGVACQHCRRSRHRTRMRHRRRAAPCRTSRLARCAVSRSPMRSCSSCARRRRRMCRMCSCARALLTDDDANAAYAPFTVVDQAVSAIATRRESSFAKGLVNAVLRNFLRERDTLIAEASRSEVARWNYPQWWIGTGKAWSARRAATHPRRG